MRISCPRAFHRLRKTLVVPGFIRKKTSNCVAINSVQSMCTTSFLNANKFGKFFQWVLFGSFHHVVLLFQVEVPDPVCVERPECVGPARYSRKQVILRERLDNVTCIKR